MNISNIFLLILIKGSRKKSSSTSGPTTKSHIYAKYCNKLAKKVNRVV